jgi:putative oxidoreductase
MNSVNIAALVLRLVVGGTMIAHGWNHAFGGGKLPGTARWFESIGIRPGRVHALAATVIELGAGALLVLGLLTPLAAAAVVAGVGGAVLLLTTSWRPGPAGVPAASSTASASSPTSAP